MYCTVAARNSIAENINMLVPWYLSASYAYYELDESLLVDTYYDEICELLDKHWDEITHRHKYLIERAALSAGTGFQLAYKNFPTIITSATHGLIRRNEAAEREVHIQHNLRGDFEFGVPVFISGKRVHGNSKLKDR
jgi:hypothetical protein